MRKLKQKIVSILAVIWVSNILLAGYVVTTNEGKFSLLEILSILFFAIPLVVFAAYCAVWGALVLSGKLTERKNHP